MNGMDKLLEKIQRDKLQVIYITGQSCTGKTTLADALDTRLGYYNVELDTVVGSLETRPGVKRWYEIYRARNELGLINDFIGRTSDTIRTSLKQHPGVTFEGAIVNKQTLRELFDSLPMAPFFIYLLPVDQALFKDRVIKRFRDSTPENTNKLNKEFWEITSKKLVADFYQTGNLAEELENEISAYVQLSMKEAKERLQQLRTSFPDIEVLEV